MRSESNPLRQELARSQQAPAGSEAHLDADLLAAFAEETLLPTERRGVLAHLAVCGQCREVLSIATVARPDGAQEASVQRISRPARSTIRGWLRWATCAAGVAAISLIVLFHPLKRVPQVTTSTIAKPAPDLRPEISPGATQQAAVSVAPQVKALHEKPATVSAEPPRIAIPQPTADVAKNQGNEQLESELAVNNAATARSGALAASQPIAGATSAKVASQSTTVQVSPAQNAMLPETMNAAPDASVGGPVRAGSVVGAFSGVSARPQWRINEAGQVERSFGNGLWQEVLDAGTAKLHVVSVLSDSVWAGGEKLRLYRSIDNGVTWSAVQLPSKGSVQNVITHVRFQTPLDGEIDTADGTSWLTTDGGITWK